MDVLHKLFTWLDHNRYAALGITLAVVGTVWLGACQPMTTSVLNPPAKVSGTGLEREAAQIASDYDAKIKQVALAREDLAAQLVIRQQIASTLGSVATMAATGQVDVTNIIGSAITLLLVVGGGGLLIDNKRKDGVIAKQKADAVPVAKEA